MSTQKPLSPAIQELSLVSDISSLRGKRGARRRGINRAKTYLGTAMDLPLVNASLGEVERQLQRLDYEIALNEATQDRIFEVMKQQSLNTPRRKRQRTESPELNKSRYAPILPISNRLPELVLWERKSGQVSTA